jgi:hypothetical protein
MAEEKYRKNKAYNQKNGSQGITLNPLAPNTIKAIGETVK